MDESVEQGSLTPGARFRLETGRDVLEEWAETASRPRKNAIYKALFATLDGSLFRAYRVVGDFQRPSEPFIIVRDDLVLKIRINCFDSLGTVHIGPPTGGSSTD
jgi:hypothetical protein